MEDALEKGQQRTEALYAMLPVERTDTVMLGDSLTEEAPWAELFPEQAMKNRGIGGQTAAQILERLDPIIDGQPRLIVLMAGSNDLAAGDDSEAVLQRLQSIMDRIGEECAATRLVVQSLLPREPELGDAIAATNAALKQCCEQRDIAFLDIHAAFADVDGGIRAALSNDRVHLLPQGYVLWRELLAPLICAQS